MPHDGKWYSKRDLKSYFSVNLNFITSYSLERNARWSSDKCFYQISRYICHYIGSSVGNFIRMTHNKTYVIVETHKEIGKTFKWGFLISGNIRPAKWPHFSFPSVHSSSYLRHANLLGSSFSNGSLYRNSNNEFFTSIFFSTADILCEVFQIFFGICGYLNRYLLQK